MKGRERESTIRRIDFIRRVLCYNGGEGNSNEATKYRAMVVSTDGSNNSVKTYSHSREPGKTLMLEGLPNQDPDATVTVRVHFSTLNYKDGMIVNGKSGVASFPIVPGIDAAGVVLESRWGMFLIVLGI